MVIAISLFTKQAYYLLNFAKKGHFEIVKYLVYKGAIIQAKTVSGKTPLELANFETYKSYCTESEKENLAKIIQFLKEILAQK